MNKDIKDKGLRKAVKERQELKLSTNFTYLTMQKAQDALRIREKKAERRTLWAIIITSAILMGGCIAWLPFSLVDSIKIKVSLGSSPLYGLIIAIPLFLLFDRWLRKQYFKRHS